MSPLSVFFLLSVWNLVSSGACTFYVSNKCPFPIWPATAPNQGRPVLARGGFYLPQGKTQKVNAPGDWSGRIWARTGCNFGSNQRVACETGDCNGQLECGGFTGLPPATLVEFALEGQPNFYDVSVVDGYNLPISVDSKRASQNCRIRGCRKNLKTTCPVELQVVNSAGQVVACKSACLAFNLDSYCCRNQYSTPQTCRPSKYSRLFKDACPSYVSYALETPSSIVTCDSNEYVITFCPDKWGTQHLSA